MPFGLPRHWPLQALSVLFRFVTSRTVWLAMYEPDSKRPLPLAGLSFDRLDWLCLEDSQWFNRQLFYWLLIRSGPCPFGRRTHYDQGIPTVMNDQN